MKSWLLAIYWRLRGRLNNRFHPEFARTCRRRAGGIAGWQTRRGPKVFAVRVEADSHPAEVARFRDCPHVGCGIAVPHTHGGGGPCNNIGSSSNGVSNG